MMGLMLQSMKWGKGSFQAFGLKHLAELEAHKWTVGIKWEEENGKTVIVGWQEYEIACV